MWNKKKKEEEALKQRHTDFVAQTPVERKPSVIEQLKKRRAEKIERAKQLDREIEMLDHDITFIERRPESARILEFINTRFKEEAKEPGRDAPWGVA